MTSLTTPSTVIAPASFIGRLRVALSAFVAAVLGVAPHVLHHVGPLAGAALFAGAGGSILFGAVGFVAAIPFLLRVRRRHSSWRIPATMLAVMAVVFTLSTVIVGPALTGGEADDAPAAQQSQPAGDAHEAHH